MTMNNGPDDKKPEQPGGGQRPYATIDLKAEHISEKPAGPSSASASAEPPRAHPQEPPAIEYSGDPSPDSPHGGATISTLITHLGAGALGAVLALIAAFTLIGGDDVPGPLADDIDALKAQVASSNQRIAALDAELRKASAAASAAQSSAGAADNLKRDLAAVTGRVGAIEARPVPAAVSDETIQRSVQQSVAPLAERLAKAEERVEGVAKAQLEIRTDSKGPALALALYNLRKAANEGLPYDAELRTVAEMSPVPLDLAALETRREQGVHSLRRLRADFDAAAEAAWQAENRPADESFLAEAWSKAKSLVRVKQRGDVPGDTTMAILARAEHRLDTSELRAALAEVEKLQPPASDAMAPWIAELKMKIAADEALAKAEATLLTALGREETAKRGG
jgi:hypothetical protein